MHRTKFILIYLLFTINFIYGQVDTLNKFNVKGKKNGYWKIYLNEKARVTKNIEDSYFFGYEYYLNGKNIGSVFKTKKKKEKYKYSDSLPVKGNPKIINGTFTFYDIYNRKFYEETYINGEVSLLRSYNYASGYRNKNDTIPILFEELNTNKKYNNLKFSYVYQVFLSNKTITYWFRDGKKGWKFYKEK